MLREVGDCLGIFSQSLYAQVFKVFNAKQWKLKEPMELPAERPARFERLCLRALSEGVISEAKVAELLRMSVHKLQKFLDQTPEGEANSGHLAGGMSEDHVLGDASRKIDEILPVDRRTGDKGALAIRLVARSSTQGCA